ncbi:MAG: GAF domain-containing protein [Solirubrobacterales bacterium]|nr:GAF domain-containing protein [Solirubrobacterales bacterium]
MGRVRARVPCPRARRLDPRSSRCWADSPRSTTSTEAPSTSPRRTACPYARSRRPGTPASTSRRWSRSGTGRWDERRSSGAQLLHDDRGSSRGALIVAPILAGGRLVGVIAFAARVSRPVGRSELLLLQAFSNRVGEVIAGGGDVERQLGVAMDRFRTSWSAAATGIA